MANSRCQAVLLTLALLLSSAGCRRAGVEQVGAFAAQRQALPAVITLISWNAQKGQSPQFTPELAQLIAHDTPDLLFLQEARAFMGQHSQLGGHFARSWSYPWPGGKTIGISTLSAVEPLSHKRLTTRFREFVVTAPKTSLLTRYQLADGARLLAINLHLLAFERGKPRHFAHQLQALAQEMHAHSGPIIMAGDFNTWSEQRLALVTTLAEQLQLTEVDGFPDTRVTAVTQSSWLNKLLGIDSNLVLDRIFVRGYTPLSVSVLDYSSSDHKAIKAQLQRLPP